MENKFRPVVGEDLHDPVPLPDAAQLGNDGNIGKFFPHLHVYGVEVIFRMVEKHDLAGAQSCKLAHQRSEEHTSELQSLMRISYAVFCLKKKNNRTKKYHD